MLELGTARVDITPRTPVPLAGFATRKGVFDRVLTPIYARIFCFRYGLQPPVVLVSADLIWWGSERLPGLRRKVREQDVLVNASLILHATHNHSGPQTSEALSPLIGEASRDYIEWMENAVLEGVREAAQACEPVTIERGAAQCRIGIHRRRLVNGSIQMAPNDDGPNDPECTVIRFRGSTGVTRAVLVHFTCHPTTTADNSVSAEFCGVAMTELERGLGPDVIAGYLQGCCGDIRPAMIKEDRFYRGDAEDVARLSAELRRVVMSVLERPMESCGSGVSPALEREVPLFFELREGHVPETESRESVALEMTLVRLTQNLGFLTFNAEAVVEYGLFVKRRSEGAILPIGYTNGMIGYVTTKRQLAEGGYESREAFRYFGMPGPFEASTELRIREAIAQWPEFAG